MKSFALMLSLRICLRSSFGQNKKKRNEGKMHKIHYLNGEQVLGLCFLPRNISLGFVYPWTDIINANLWNEKSGGVGMVSLIFHTQIQFSLASNASTRYGQPVSNFPLSFHSSGKSDFECFIALFWGRGAAMSIKATWTRLSSVLCANLE